MRKLSRLMLGCAMFVLLAIALIGPLSAVQPIGQGAEAVEMGGPPALGLALPANDQGVNWPSFRGEGTSGVSHGHTTPTVWSVPDGKKVKWKTGIPGLGHSSPIVWGDRVFVATAISGKSDPSLRVGLYGDIAPVDDETVHKWEVYCLDKNNKISELTGDG